MKTFIITAHIEFYSKAKPIPPQTAIQTGLIRMEIPAEDEEEARTKARYFILGRTAIVVDGCELKPAEPNAAQKAFAEKVKPSADIFKNWKPGK